MTIRDLGEAGIKLIGVYFGASGLIGVVRVAISFFMPPIEGFPSSSTIALLNGFAVVGALGVAALCLLGANALSNRIFARHDQELVGLSRHDLLVIGLALLGVATAMRGAPNVMEFAGRAAWYGEASRRSQFMGIMQGNWARLFDNTLELVLGVALVLWADRLASALDRRYSVPPRDHREPAA